MAEGELVRFEVVDGVGVITIDNPPVNALSPGVPDGIVAFPRGFGFGHGRFVSD